MSKTTPKQAGQRLIDRFAQKMGQYIADISAERQTIIDDDLSREVLIELLAVARVNLRNAKADSEAQRQQHHRNSEAHWEHADRLAVKRERKNTQGKGAEATKRHRDKAMKKAQELWKEIGHQFQHGGKPSKSSFADHILKNNLLPSKPDGKRWGKKAITDTWLKGL